MLIFDPGYLKKKQARNKMTLSTYSEAQYRPAKPWHSHPHMNPTSSHNHCVIGFAILFIGHRSTYTKTKLRLSVGLIQLQRIFLAFPHGNRNETTIEIASQ